MKRKILAFTLVLMLILSMSVCAFADNPVSEARNGVAVLVTLERGDDFLNYVSNGSCFFIGKAGENPKYLLTNHHVVSDYLKYGAGATKTYTVNGVSYSSKMILRVYFGAGDYEEAYVVASDEAQDIALLRLASATEKRVALPLLAPTDELIGKQVYAIGFPDYSDIVEPTSAWSVKDALVTNCPISRYYTESGTGAQWIQFAATEWGGGNSGGPLVTEEGAVIGLVSWGISTSANSLYVGVNVESIFPMLRNNNIEFELFSDNKGTTSEQDTPGSSTPDPSEVTPKPEINTPTPEINTPTPEINTPTPAVSNTPDEPTTPPDTPVNPSGFTIEPWMYAVAAGLLALIILLIVLLSKKKGGKGGDSGAGESKGEKAKVGYVRSLAAQHNGLRVQVGKEPVVIGRQGSCTIRFQADTPGVSGVHCSVSYDAASNEFILTDLKSSYGTFLETGQRLTPHTPTRIRSGDSFYAGDRRNILRVESSEQ